MKVQSLNQNKTERSSNSLTQAEIDWLKEIFGRRYITYTWPEMKYHKYLQKVDGESMFAQKRYLLWSMQDILGLLNLISNEGVESFNSKFSKEIIFRQLYEFIKIQGQLVYNKDISQSSCFFKIYKNVVCYSKPLSRNKHVLQNNLNNLVEQSSSNSTSRSCIHGHTRTICESLVLNLREFYFHQVNQEVYYR